MKNISRLNIWKIIIPFSIFLVILISGCSQAGVSKEARLEAFIIEMESGVDANPRSHFAGHPSAYKIDSDTFDFTNMDPENNLDITGYVITGDTFTMDYTTDAFGSETVLTASFYVESGSLGGDVWFIKSMTVPTAGEPGGLKVIPDSL